METKKRLADKMEAYMQAMTQADEFCGEVLVAQEGEVLLTGGYGLADREHDVPNTPQTKFRLGSITKQFTSMAILMLAEQGKLDVHDPISRHLPYSPTHWKDITVHHLLNHTSGLGNLADIPGIRETKARLSLSVRELVETFREIPLEFRTGTAFRYSNSGYIVLGDMIECVSGLSYEEFLQTHIFGPLEVADSGYDHYQTILKNRATGYLKRDGEWVRAEYVDMSFPLSARALYSTVEDLYRWGQTLDTNRLISSEAYTRMTTLTPLLTTYGYGLIIGCLHNRRTVGHAGGVNGFRANFIRFPDEHASVVVLSNSEESDFFGITKALAAVLFGEDYEMPEVKSPVKVADVLLSSYAGVYEIVPGVTLEVEEHEGNLRVTYGQAKSVFVPQSDTLFHCNDNSITFHLSGDAVSHLTLSQAQTHSPQSKVEVEARKMNAVVTAVSQSTVHEFSKQSQKTIQLVAGFGVEGDAHSGQTVQHRSRVARDPSQPNFRQVHLIHAELHDELRAAGFCVSAGDMGENITTRGVDLLGLPTGTRLHLGASAVVEITGLRNPCPQLDAFQPGLTAAVLDHDANGNLIRKAGIMGIVVVGGEVKPNDLIRVVLPPQPHEPLKPV